MARDGAHLPDAEQIVVEDACPCYCRHPKVEEKIGCRFEKDLCKNRHTIYVSTVAVYLFGTYCMDKSDDDFGGVSFFAGKE